MRLVAACLLFSSTALAESPERLLVLPLRTDAGREAEAAVLDLLFSTLRYELLGPGDIGAVLGPEALKAAQSCDVLACTKQLGVPLEAAQLVLLQLQKGELSLQLVDVKTKKVVQRAKASGELTKTLPAAIDTLLPPVAGMPTLVLLNGPDNPYLAYQQQVMRLQRLETMHETTALLEAVTAAKKSPAPGPPGQETLEMLTYYEVNACATLKRTACVDEGAKKYQARWPQGAYVSTIDFLVQEQKDEAARRAEGKKELDKQLQDIQAMAQGLTPAQIEQQRAWAYSAASMDAEAAEAFAKARGASKEDWFSITLALVGAYQSAGMFEEARQVMREARQREPRAFEEQGMKDMLARLPR